MKIYIHLIVGLLFLSVQAPISAQAETNSAEQTTTPLFMSDEPLQVRLSYSNRGLLKDTNDTTYLNTMLHYREGDGAWDSIQVRVRARGNFRKANCFLSPVKVRIKKKHAEGTLFEGNKELKLVYPCMNTDDGADYVLKEYLAYKFYEHITPYHFKARRLKLEYTDERNRKEKAYELEAFMIEDIDKVAERNNGNKLKRKVHPLQQDHTASIQNDFFQFMIGNTDFSAAYQHNGKLVFVEDRQAIPVPYDFDMSGWCNTSYSVVSQVGGEQLPIEKVTQRLYRGYKRDPGMFQLVREQYLDTKDEIIGVLEAHEGDFHNPRSYKAAHDFLGDFFKVLQNDDEYRRNIVAMAREVE